MCASGWGRGGGGYKRSPLYRAAGRGPGETPGTHMSRQQTAPPQAGLVELYAAADGELYEDTASQAARYTVVPEGGVALHATPQQCHCTPRCHLLDTDRPHDRSITLQDLELCSLELTIKAPIKWKILVQKAKFTSLQGAREPFIAHYLNRSSHTREKLNQHGS